VPWITCGETARRRSVGPDLWLSGAEDFDLEPWPYSAFFGALRLRDEVKVDFDVALTPDD
jgi:hypothetical protein